MLTAPAEGGKEREKKKKPTHPAEHSSVYSVLIILILLALQCSCISVTKDHWGYNIGHCQFNSSSCSFHGENWDAERTHRSVHVHSGGRVTTIFLSIQAAERQRGHACPELKCSMKRNLNRLFKSGSDVTADTARRKHGRWDLASCGGDLHRARRTREDTDEYALQSKCQHTVSFILSVNVWLLQNYESTSGETGEKQHIETQDNFYFLVLLFPLVCHKLLEIQMCVNEINQYENMSSSVGYKWSSITSELPRHFFSSLFAYVTDRTTT